MEKIWQSIQSMVEKASMVTGRTMEVTNFQFSSSLFEGPTGEVGVIRYSFEWTNFVKTENSHVKVGDALSGEFDLGKGDMLTIKFPSSFQAIVVSPVPDEIDKSKAIVVWYGPRNFGAGEPTIIFGTEQTDLAQFLIQNLLLIILFAASCVSFILFFVVRRKRLKEKAGTLEVGFEANEDKNRVIRLLQNSGGKLYQSEIAARTGFSAAKTSMILKALEEQGVITRRKIGNRKLVILALKQER